VECLYDPLDEDLGVPLHDGQRGSQRALRVWPRERDAFRWYSGSAVVNAWCLGNAARGDHLLELYELAPETRAVLRAVFADPGLRLPRATVRVLPEAEDWLEFDGEAHIERSIASLDSRDVILLDPFAMWRQPGDRKRRNRYPRIFDQLLALPEPPQLLLFWTWGRAFPVADGDLQGTNAPVTNGYQELRQVLHSGNRHIVRVSWRWGLQFAMWVVLPPSHLEPFALTLRQRCDEIRDHLRRHGCASRLSRPDIEVLVD
jgi:hypothetical protein